MPFRGRQGGGIKPSQSRPRSELQGVGYNGALLVKDILWIILRLQRAKAGVIRTKGLLNSYLIYISLVISII